jgi:hypothetical protein
MFDGVSTKPDVVSDIEPDPELEIDPDPDSRNGRFESSELFDAGFGLDDMETGLGAGAIVDSDGFELGRGTWLEPDLILCVAMVSVPCGYDSSLNTNLKIDGSAQKSMQRVAVSIKLLLKIEMMYFL